MNEYDENEIIMIIISIALAVINENANDKIISIKLFLFKQRMSINNILEMLPPVISSYNSINFQIHSRVFISMSYDFPT